MEQKSSQFTYYVQGYVVSGKQSLYKHNDMLEMIKVISNFGQP